MDSKQIKQELLNTIRIERARWDALIQQIPAALMAEPGIEGDNGEWTVKDLIAHVAQYEDWMAQLLNARGPNIPHEVDTMTQEERNAWIYRQHKDRPVDEVLSQARQAHAHLIAAIETLPADEITATDKFEWTRARPVHQLIPHETYLHYKDHMLSLVRFIEVKKQ